MLQAKLIDCGGGNISSAYNALLKTAPNNMAVSVINRADDLADADYVILPGQGDFQKFMDALIADGWQAQLQEKIIQQAYPLLGICVGMQIMLEGSVERADKDTPFHKGLGWVKGIAEKLDKHHGDLKIPQMGWNDLEFMHDHPVFKGLGKGMDAYFVHSYGLLLRDAMPDSVLAKAHYGDDFAAIIGRDNFIGMQFHAEKSHDAGLKLIENFLRWQA